MGSFSPAPRSARRCGDSGPGSGAAATTRAERRATDALHSASVADPAGSAGPPTRARAAAAGEAQLSGPARRPSPRRKQSHVVMTCRVAPFRAGPAILGPAWDWTRSAWIAGPGSLNRFLQTRPRAVKERVPTETRFLLSESGGYWCCYPGRPGRGPVSPKCSV